MWNQPRCGASVLLRDAWEMVCGACWMVCSAWGVVRGAFPYDCRGASSTLRSFRYNSRAHKGLNGDWKANSTMCYQCFGCGKCAGVTPDPDKNMCPMCKRVVEDGVRWCPDCGAYIRPKTGSLAAKAKRARARAQAAGLPSESQADAQNQVAASGVKLPAAPSGSAS